MKEKHHFKELLYFSRYVQPYRLFYVFTFCAMLAQAVLGLLQPLFYRRLIDDVFNAADPRQHLSLFISIVSILAGIRILSIVLGMISTVFNTRVTTAATNALEFDILKKLHSVPVKYHDRHAPGEIFPRLYNDPGQVITFYLNFLPQLAVSLIRITIVFFVILFHFWWAGLIALLPIIPMWFISKLNIRYFKELSDKQFKKQQGLYTRVLDMLHGIRIVRLFHQSEREMARFRMIQNDLRSLHIEASKRNAWMSPLIGTVGRLGGAIIFLAGAARLMQLIPFGDTEFTLGTLFMVLSYVWQLADPITYFANYSSQFGSIRGASGRILALLDEPEQEGVETELVSVDTTSVDTTSIVDFKNVHFSYDPGKTVLSEISFGIKPGEKIGLVGPSGSGKTTLLNLICGFYRADSGCIRVGGCSPGSRIASRMSPLLSIAMQDGELFRGSIRENIGYGCPECSEQTILDALETVEATEFTLSMPNGLDTQVGEGSRMLSSGQMQRLSLARAIAADADILILDEATSWVDLWTEQRIFSRLLKKYKNKTIICISHRLHLMQLMDRVLVLRNGRLVNQGTHSQLIRHDPFYAATWELRDCEGYAGDGTGL